MRKCPLQKICRDCLRQKISFIFFLQTRKHYAVMLLYVYMSLYVDNYCSFAKLLNSIFKTRKLQFFYYLLPFCLLYTIQSRMYGFENGLVKIYLRTYLTLLTLKQIKVILLFAWTKIQLVMHVLK